jgi:hypothetical protein
MILSNIFSKQLAILHNSNFVITHKSEVKIANKFGDILKKTFAHPQITKYRNSKYSFSCQFHLSKPCKQIFLYLNGRCVQNKFTAAVIK